MNENTVTELKKYYHQYGTLGRALSALRFNLDMSRPQLLLDLDLAKTQSHIYTMQLIENKEIKKSRLIDKLMGIINKEE